MTEWQFFVIVDLRDLWAILSSYFFHAKLAKRAGKPITGDFVSQCIPQLLFYTAGVAEYITLGLTLDAKQQEKIVSSHRTCVRPPLRSRSIRSLQQCFSPSWVPSSRWLFYGLKSVLFFKLTISLSKTVTC